MSYSPAAIAVAKQIHDFWKAKGCDGIHWSAFIADGDRETSLNPYVGGDKVNGVATAYDLAQHHKDRRDFIRLHTKIDMKTASVPDQCAGIYFEITSPYSPYRHVWPMLISATTAKSVNLILIHSFEQSGNQARDLARQLPMADWWLAYGEKNWK